VLYQLPPRNALSCTASASTDTSKRLFPVFMYAFL
jgi:hypothetical protein